jgi:uncharacterized membrane protein SirB2
MSAIKAIHIVCAALSISGFIWRGGLMIKGSALLNQRWLKIAPHVIDTVLLASALLLAAQWGMAAFSLPWLWAKVIALCLYIALGTIALHAGRSKGARISAWLAAMVVFAYIVAVAISKQPWPLS